MVFWRGCLHPYPKLSRDAGYLSSLVRQELKPKTEENKREVLFRRRTSRWNIRQSSWIAGRVGGLGQLPSIKKLRRTAVCKDELPEQGKGGEKKNIRRGFIQTSIDAFTRPGNYRFHRPVPHWSWKVQYLISKPILLRLSPHVEVHLFNYLSTDFMELKWTGNSPLSGHKITPVNPYPSHLNPDHTFVSFFLIITLLLLSSHLLTGLPSCFFPPRFLTFYKFLVSHLLILSSFSWSQ